MRRRIMLLVVGMTTLVVLAFAIPLAILIRHVVYNDALTKLQNTAAGVAFALRGESGAPTVHDLGDYLTELRPRYRASVVLPSGQVVGYPPPAGTQKPTTDRRPGGSPTDERPGPHDRGGSPGAPLGGGPPQPLTTAYGSGQLTQLVVPSQRGSYQVRVYASNDELHSGETAWWWLLFGVSIGLLVVGVGASELLTRRIVKPLVQTAQTAHRLADGDVAARATTSGPAEVSEVGRSLNLLADRIDELIAEERETVADLSHRLRTPLTVLRLDAEALRDPVEAERVGAQVSTLERMLTAVIRAARRPQREGRLPSCDATQVVRERAAFWSALAEDQGRTGAIDLPDTALRVRASGDDLAAAVDALLENVIAHTPEGTGYAIRLVPDGFGARLEVADDGPGLPPDASERGRSDRGSSGLGLDIARRCAESSGGSMTLGASRSGGTLVTLLLGAA